MQILKKLLIFSFLLFSLESFASDHEEMTFSSFKESLTTLNPENVSEKDFLERFELALNNVIPDELDPAIPQEAQKFRASYQAVIDLYEAYNNILESKMAEFIGSVKTEDKSLIVKLMIYKDSGILKGYSGGIDKFIEDFIDSWPKELLTEEKLEILCYAADSKISMLNLFIEKKLVSEKLIKKLLPSLSDQLEIVYIIFNVLNNKLIDLPNLLECLDMLNLERKIELINVCIDHSQKLNLKNGFFDRCFPYILTVPDFYKINIWPNPYRAFSTRNAIFAFAIRRSVISEENLPEYLDQLSKMDQLQLIEDLCKVGLIKKESLSPWVEKLPKTEFRGFIEAYIEEKI